MFDSSTTAANIKMMRLSGRCRRGERLIGCVPQWHWRPLWPRSVAPSQPRASATADGSMNGAHVLAHIKHYLLQPQPQDNIVIEISLRTKLVAFARESKRVAPGFPICPITCPT
jgi:hypothetical protein